MCAVRTFVDNVFPHIYISNFVHIKVYAPSMNLQSFIVTVILLVGDTSQHIFE